MHNYTEHMVLHLTKLEKDYIEKLAEKACLSIEQFLILCVISLENIADK